MTSRRGLGETAGGGGYYGYYGSYSMRRLAASTMSRVAGGYYGYGGYYGGGMMRRSTMEAAPMGESEDKGTRAAVVASNPGHTQTHTPCTAAATRNHPGYYYAVPPTYYARRLATVVTDDEGDVMWLGRRAMDDETSSLRQRRRMLGGMSPGGYYGEWAMIGRSELCGAPGRTLGGAAPLSLGVGLRRSPPLPTLRPPPLAHPTRWLLLRLHLSALSLSSNNGSSSSRRQQHRLHLSALAPSSARQPTSPSQTYLDHSICASSWLKPPALPAPQPPP